MNKTKIMTVKVGLEIERLATEEAERIIAGKLYEAEELLKLHFERVSRKFGYEIKEALLNKYELVQKGS